MNRFMKFGKGHQIVNGTLARIHQLEMVNEHHCHAHTMQTNFETVALGHVHKEYYSIS